MLQKILFVKLCGDLVFKEPKKDKSEKIDDDGFGEEYGDEDDDDGNYGDEGGDNDDMDDGDYGDEGGDDDFGLGGMDDGFGDSE